MIKIRPKRTDDDDETKTGGSRDYNAKLEHTDDKQGAECGEEGR